MSKDYQSEAEVRLKKLKQIKKAGSRFSAYVPQQARDSGGQALLDFYEK